MQERLIVTKKGDLKGYGTVWYHPEGIANILFLNNIQKKYKVTYDISENTSFIVHEVMYFHPLKGAILL